MATRKPGVPDHCVLMSFGQPAGLSHAVAFNDMLNDGNHLVVGKARIKKDGSSAFGKGLFALQTVEQPCGLLTILGVIPGSHADIFASTNPVLGAIFILTTKLLQVVHENNSVRKLTKSKDLRERTQNTNLLKTCQY
jgi:hypothetical protein